jgi:uncharacterized membrane protein
VKSPASGSADRPSDQAMAGVVERNIRALREHRQEQEKARRLQDRSADAITRFTGSMKFVYLHVAIFGLWIVINLGWLPFPPFDETFVVLAMVASVEAIFLSTFVLISQNRMAALPTSARISISSEPARGARSHAVDHTRHCDRSPNGGGSLA